MKCKITFFYRYFLFITFIFCIGWKGLNGITIKHAVHRFFEYFNTDDPRGLPVIDLEDPLELISPLETVPLSLHNGRLFGVSNIKIEHVFLNFLSLTGSLKATAPRLEINGQYKWPTLFSESSGFMNATLVNSTFCGNLSMFIDGEHKISVLNLELNETNDDVHLDFTNLMWTHQLLFETGVVEVFFHDIFDEFIRQLKPVLLEEINQGISKFISSLPSVEFFIPSEKDLSSSISSSEKKKSSESFETILHRLLLFLGMEPLYLPDKNTKILGVNFKVSEVILHGASKVSKLECLDVYYENKKLWIEVEMTYPRLLLFYKIKMSGGKAIDVDIYEKNQLNNVYINARVVIDLKLEEPPSLRYFDIHVGSFGKVRERKKSFWGKIVGAFTDFKDLILREIVNALQGTIQKAVQKKLNSTDVENGLVYILERIYFVQ